VTTTILTVLAVMLAIAAMKVAWKSVTFLSKRNRWK
jgi:hypothetical protein